MTGDARARSRSTIASRALALSAAVVGSSSLAACGSDEASLSTSGSSAPTRAHEVKCTFGQATPGLATETKRDVRIGPVLFKAGATFAGRENATVFDADGWKDFKTVTITEGGAEVLVEVLRAQGRIQMIYGSEAMSPRGDYRASDGSNAVLFERCSGPQPEPADAPGPPGIKNVADYGEFNGGFIAARPGCYELRVTSVAGKSYSGLINIGQPESRCVPG
jgi:major membrane immunogen (membrane-anchored lipoprotein)